MNLVLVAVAETIVTVGVAGPSSAQSYPQRPIRLIAPTGPGETLDLSARLLARLWSETLGQPIIVVNRAGGASAIGNRSVAHAAADGYTLTSDSSFVTVPLTRSDVGCTLEDFAFLFAYVQRTLFLAMRSGSPHASLAEFLAAAQQAPGRLN